MCGRFTLKEKLKVLNKFNIDIEPSYNICPSNKVLILDKNLYPIFLKWGFSQNWSNNKLTLVNARNETINEKSYFKNSERCIFIADGYFEWMKSNEKKFPFYHHMNGDLMFFAGIYNKNGCCIVTIEANENISFIHHRQPLILYENELLNWVNNKNGLFISTEVKKINYYRVKETVNTPENNSEHNLRPFSYKSS